MLFLWENYLREEKEENEEEKSSEKKEHCLKIQDIYKALKKLDGIKNISLDNQGMPMFNEDGRKKIKVNITFEKDTDISEQIAKVVEEVPGYQIKIENIEIIYITKVFNDIKMYKFIIWNSLGTINMLGGELKF